MGTASPLGGVPDTRIAVVGLMTERVAATVGGATVAVRADGAEHAYCVPPLPLSSYVAAAKHT